MHWSYIIKNIYWVRYFCVNKLRNFTKSTLFWPLATLVYLYKLLFKIAFLYIFTFLCKTLPLFCHYHSLLELQKHHLYHLLSYLLSICLDFPECITYIHSFCYSDSCPFHSRTISFIEAIPHHHTNFNPWKLEFNSGNSRANLSKIYCCIWSHIVRKDSHPSPSSFHLWNIDNDTIYSIPWYLSIPFHCTPPPSSLQFHLFLLHSMYLNGLHSFTNLYRTHTMTRDGLVLF